ncbi:MAG: hypothetical protein COA63_014150 [Methylophaga sp.]|nr:hypothetical protein [Methylophaga sp.]
MGTTIAVSSVVYPLFGEDNDINYTKSVILGFQISGNTHKKYLGETLVKAQLNGPTMDQRRYFNWAKKNYELGLPKSSSNTQVIQDTSSIQLILPGSNPVIDSSVITHADIIYWAEQYILINQPSEYNTNWTADYIGTNVIIQFVSGSTVSFIPQDFDKTANYVVTYYHAGSNNFVFIYKFGSGNTDIDSILYISEDYEPEYFPFIPLRLDNKSISDPAFAQDIYPDCVKAFKKATNSDLEDILEKIEENDNIADIDYAFMISGIHAGTSDKSGKLYIYNYLKNISLKQQTQGLIYDNWVSAGSVPLDIPVKTTIRIQSINSDIDNYDISISWLNIHESFHTGLGKVDAKTGDLWWESVAGFVTEFYLFKQVSSTKYTKLRITNLSMHNYVYKANTVYSTLGNAIDGSEEGEGFIFPLHYPTIKKLPLTHANQIVSISSMIVFNTYQIHKQKWYESFWFKLFVFVAAIAISVLTGGVGASTVGLLGTNIAVGSALGLTGTVAVIIGAVVNAAAAIILTSLIQAGAIALFGDKLGSIIGTIVGFMAIQVGMSFAQSGFTSVNWGNMLRAENLLKLTQVSVNAYSKWLNADTQEIKLQGIKSKEEYDVEMEEIQDLTSELIGNSMLIDPITFTNSSNNDNFIQEPVDLFLRRTLLTGSEIVELSQNMISDFAEITLELPKLT